MSRVKNIETPRHIGIIMDGNGRWAKRRGLPRSVGHQQGAKTFHKCVDNCIDLGLEYVTFYAFSTENWSRPTEETDALIKLFDKYLDDIRSMADKNTRLRFLGDIKLFPVSLQKKMLDAEQETRHNTGLGCSLAVNYGGRDEILGAVNRLLSENCGAVSFEQLEAKLYTAGLPDVDLIIRPSGEMRLSNFMLWQSAYAEFVFMDVLWPDFTMKHLKKALSEYAERNRRFGGI